MVASNVFSLFSQSVKFFMLEFFRNSSPKMLNKIVQLQNLVKFVAEDQWSPLEKFGILFIVYKNGWC